MKAQVALVAGVRRLGAIDGAARDARYLLAHALSVPLDRLTLVLQDEISDDAVARFNAAIDARITHQPVAQITGKRLFWGRTFRVTRDTLDPRPETEILIEGAFGGTFRRVLDMGTGTGCIALTLAAERVDAHVVATDISDAALAIARENATSLNVSDRVAFIQSDWFADVDGIFDLIVSNPPYIAADEMDALAPDVRLWEPHLALTPGGDGLEPYRVIAAGAMAHLSPLGRVGVEIGPTQGAQVSALFAAAGFADVQVVRDFDGRDRCVWGQKRNE